MRRRGLALVLLVGLAAPGCFPRDGSGRVQADFTITDCPPGDDNDDLAGYAFDAAFLGVTRYLDDLSIQLLEHRSLVEETDGLSIRFRMSDLVAAGQLVCDRDCDDSDVRYVLAQSPLELPLEVSTLGARASLSMFQTCPDFPTVHATSGVLRFETFRIAKDPEDLGHDERLVGTLTASISRGSPWQAAGRLEAEFAFDVPRRPLMSVQ